MEVANDTHEEVKGYGKLYLLIKQSGGAVKATTLQRVALLLFRIFAVPAVSGTGGKYSGEGGQNPRRKGVPGERRVYMLLPRGELGTINHRNKSIAAQPAALDVQAVQQYKLMGIHNILGHPNEKTTRDTTEAVGIELTGKWEHYEGCSTAKAYRHAVPTSTDKERAKEMTRALALVTGRRSMVQ